ALLERELATLVAAPLHLGLAQAALEPGMARQKRSVQELRLLHDDPPARADDARELAQRLARLLDVVKDVAAPDPVEARVGPAQLRGVPHPELEPRTDGPMADELARRVRALGRRLDAHDAPARPDRLGQPDGEEAGAAPDVEPTRAFGQMEV